MTAGMAALGLLPAGLSHAVGAETSRPFAVVIIGGLVTATLLTLFILPIIYPLFDSGTVEERPSMTSEVEQPEATVLDSA
jgi:cobalt-zinc-cadmium resistance protein CzcA